jgi:hypothetical protein
MTCPYCQNDDKTLFDYDPVRKVLYCNVCSKRVPLVTVPDADEPQPRVPVSARVH